MRLYSGGGIDRGVKPQIKQQANHLLVWQLDEEEEDSKHYKYKRDKSLGILCQQFIGLFVTWRHVISLEEAARQISLKEEGLEDDEEDLAACNGDES